MASIQGLPCEKVLLYNGQLYLFEHEIRRFAIHLLMGHFKVISTNVDFFNMGL